MKNKGNMFLIESEYLDEKGRIPAFLVGNNRITRFSIRRNHISFIIQIRAVGNKKSIQIESNETIELDCFYKIAMNVIRFENLFEGRFFSVVSIKLDDEELLTELGEHFLGYMTSNKVMASFNIMFDNKSYKTLFIAFEKYIEKRTLQYHVSLYASYLMGMTADLKLSLFLEVFEPLIIELGNDGKVQLKTNPHRIESAKCKKCGAMVTKKIKNKELHLSDYLSTAIRNYGKDIFLGDSVTKIVKKSVNLRNSIFHVENKKGIMNGSECAHYLYKFSLLYRIIVMQEIGIPYDYIQGRVKVLVKDFNRRFPDQRILP